MLALAKLRAVPTWLREKILAYMRTCRSETSGSTKNLWRQRPSSTEGHPDEALSLENPRRFISLPGPGTFNTQKNFRLTRSSYGRFNRRYPTRTLRADGTSCRAPCRNVPSATPDWDLGGDDVAAHGLPENPVQHGFVAPTLHVLRRGSGKASPPKSDHRRAVIQSKRGNGSASDSGNARTPGSGYSATHYLVGRAFRLLGQNDSDKPPWNSRVAAASEEARLASIVEELQNRCLDPNVRVVDLLRKVKLVATKLQLSDTLDWVEHEQAGYKAAASIPKYRDVRGVARWWNPMLGWRPVIFDNQADNDRASVQPIGNPISQIEDMAHQSLR